MNTRRKFIQTVGAGVTASALSLSPLGSFARNISQNDSNTSKIRIGIVGAENSHAEIISKMMNVDKKFPGVEVVAIWGEKEEFARSTMEKGNIPLMVKDPEEMLGKIDAVIIDHRHPEYHLKAATPFIKEGIPAFVDKPFCYRLDEGIEFLKMARELGTPVTSFSTIAQSDATFDIAEQVKTLGEYDNIIRFGPVEVDSPWGGIFFYGVHIVQPLMFMFGDDIVEVKVNTYDNKGGANVVFGNGKIATLVFNTKHYGWDTYVEKKEGIIPLSSRVSETDPARCYKDMIEMFRTGKEPRTHENILKCVAVLEAMEKSVISSKWEKVASVSL
jgi:predicted dehydrogenase